MAFLPRGNQSSGIYLSPHGKLMAVDVNGGDRITVGVPKALFQMRLPMDFDWGSGNYAVAADGQRFLVTTPAENLPHLRSR